MKNKQPVRRAPATSFRWLAAALFACLVHAPALGQDSTEAPGELLDWISGGIALSQNYDDNFLEYSSTEIRQFNEGTRPTKYVLENTTDLVTSLRTRITLAPPLFSGGFRTLLRAKLNRSWNRTNSFRTYTTWGLELKQFLWEKNSIAFQFNSLPKYYLRNIFYHRYRQVSRLPSQYIPEELSKKSYAVELGRRLTPKLTAAFNYKQERATYNQEFYERSNTARDYALETDYRFSRWIRGGLDLTFSELWAHGRDDVGSPAHDSLSDISSRSVRIMATCIVNLKPWIGVPLEVQPELTLEHQTYLSGKPWDAFHFGRIDRYAKFATELRYPLLRRLDCSLQYSWEQNRTNLGDTGDAGSYQEHRVGVGMEYSL